MIFERIKCFKTKNIRANNWGREAKGENTTTPV